MPTPSGPTCLPLRLCRDLSTRSATSPSRLTLYTAPHCDLCTVMRQEISKAAEKVPLTLSTFNIRDDVLPDVDKWRRRYQYDIPVLHLEGEEIFRHRLKAEDLVKVLQQAQTQGQTQPESKTQP